MNPPGPGRHGCTTHTRIPEELRAVVEQFADRLQPWLERMAQEGDPAQSPAAGSVPCTWCPICALIITLRGERPEAVARLAEHGVGLIAAARELLTQPAGPAPAQGEPAGPSAAPPPGRTVQHIVVRPAAPGPDGAAGC